VQSGSSSSSSGGVDDAKTEEEGESGQDGSEREEEGESEEGAERKEERWAEAAVGTNGAAVTMRFEDASAGRTSGAAGEGGC